MRGRLTMSRGGNERVLRLELRDESSRNRVLVAEIEDPSSISDFMFGMAEVPCDIKLSKIDTLGSKKISKMVEIDTIGRHLYKGGDKAPLIEKLREWVPAHHEGWELNDALTSKGSIKLNKHDDFYTVRFCISTYFSASTLAILALGFSSKNYDRDDYSMRRKIIDKSRIFDSDVKAVDWIRPESISNISRDGEVAIMFDIGGSLLAWEYFDAGEVYDLFEEKIQTQINK